MNYQMLKKIVKEITMCSKTGTEIVYKPDPDVDIEEFKQEPMDLREILSSLSSETNSISELSTQVN